MYSFIYTAIPDPIVNIVVDGTNIPGQALSLTCVVGVVDRLVVQPVITWEKYSHESVSANTISVKPSRDGNNSTLSFSSLHASDAGLYICRATVTIDIIDVSMIVEVSQNITLQSKYLYYNSPRIIFYFKRTSLSSHRFLITLIDVNSINNTC